MQYERIMLKRIIKVAERPFLFAVVLISSSIMFPLILLETNIIYIRVARIVIIFSFPRRLRLPNNNVKLQVLRD